MFSPISDAAARRTLALLPLGALAAAAYVAAVLFLLLSVDRGDPTALLLCVTALLAGYPAGLTLLSARTAMRLGIGLRLVAVFAFPLLSDDIFRFLWDGELWLAGLHPLEAVPESLAGLGGEHAAFAKTHTGLLAAMNSPGYFTVYPPLAQGLFAVAAALSRDAYWGSVVLKAVLFAGELGVLALLTRLSPYRSGRAAAAYALHPLPIVELIGNAHAEGLALLGVLAALYALRCGTASSRGGWNRGGGIGHLVVAGSALALGVLAKLVPLILTPALGLTVLCRRGDRVVGERVVGDRSSQQPRGRAWDWRGLLIAAATVTIVILGGFAVFLAGADVRGFGESLDLYFRTFEFNGSLYAFARAVGYWYRGWNWIAVVGPGLSLVGATGILAVAGYRAWRGLDLAETLLWCTALYLACATTVHPWYFAYLIGLGALTRFRWPYLLGITGFLSYLAYAQAPVAVPVWVLTCEYLPPAALAVWELRRPREWRAARGSILAR